MRIGEYETHPAADTFPMLSRGEFAALRDDIRDHGLRNPIALYVSQDPTLDTPPPYVLDGRNRLMACVELGLPPRFVEVSDHPFHYVISQNAKRRDMEALAKACAVQTALDAAQSWDRVVRKIRDEGNEKRSRSAEGNQNASKKQSLTTLSATVSGHAAPGPRKTGGAPVTRQTLAEKAGVSEGTAQKALELKKVAPDIYAKVAAGEMKGGAGVRAAAERKREAERAAAVDAVSSLAPDDRVSLHVCAVADLVAVIAPESVDVIITDPPYPREFLGVYRELAATAARVLKPGGSCVVMIGQSYLPDVVAMLAEHLSYQWTCAYLTPGGQAVQVWDRKVNTFWKPLLWFTRGEYRGDWIGDVTRSDVNDNDKRQHHWGQSVSGMVDVVERFSKPGDLICDPFCGAGTTGVAAMLSARRFVGCDVDEGCVAQARLRCAEAGA